MQMGILACHFQDCFQCSLTKWEIEAKKLSFKAFLIIKISSDLLFFIIPSINSHSTINQ